MKRVKKTQKNNVPILRDLKFLIKITENHHIHKQLLVSHVIFKISEHDENGKHSTNRAQLSSVSQSNVKFPHVSTSSPALEALITKLQRTCNALRTSMLPGTSMACDFKMRTWKQSQKLCNHRRF